MIRLDPVFARNRLHRIQPLLYKVLLPRVHVDRIAIAAQCVDRLGNLYARVLQEFRDRRKLFVKLHQPLQGTFCGGDHPRHVGVVVVG